MSQQQDATVLGPVRRFFESPLAMALVAIMATFVIGQLIIPQLLLTAPLGQELAEVEQTLALVVMAVIGIHALAAELERMLHGFHPHRPLEE
jgi:cytochrome b561